MPYKDPEIGKASAKARYQANRAAILARVKKYASQNREMIRVSQHEKYERHKGEISATTRAARAANPEPFRQRERERRLKKLAHVRALDRLRYQREKERRKKAANEYRLQNPDKRADAQQRRRALKAGAIIERVLRSDILARDGPNCQFCGIETKQPMHKKPSPEDRHYDHIIPLSRGGAHTMENTRILCASCNGHKHSRLDCELIEGHLHASQ